jgi:hypothetical protein
MNKTEERSVECEVCEATYTPAQFHSYTCEVESPKGEPFFICRSHNKAQVEQAGANLDA